MFTVLTNGQGTHASIQAALDAAPSGSTIHIAPGRYAETLVITKPVTLMGAGWEKTIIGPTQPWTEPPADALRDAERRTREAKTDEERRQLIEEFMARHLKPVVRIQGAKGVQMRGLKFTLPGIAPEGRLSSASVILAREAELAMQDCAIVGSPGNGLVLGVGANTSLSNCLFAAVWNTGIVVERTRTPSRVTVMDSDIRNCHYAGIMIGRGAADVRIERCRVSGAAWHGIRYDDASPTIADSLIFANARCGVYASGKTAARVSGNVLWKNEMNGMSCSFENRDHITNNTFAANRREGLSVLGASVPDIARNIFWQNPQGIQQGSIGSEPATAKAVTTLQLRENLFWANETNLISSAGRKEGDTNTPVKLSLGNFPGNREADPGFRNAESGDFTALSAGVAAKAGAGAMQALPTASPWPLQPEEQAIIPDGETRDSQQWKRPSLQKP